MRSLSVHYARVLDLKRGAWSTRTLFQSIVLKSKDSGAVSVPKSGESRTAVSGTLNMDEAVIVRSMNIY